MSGIWSLNANIRRSILYLFGKCDKYDISNIILILKDRILCKILIIRIENGIPVVCTWKAVEYVTVNQPYDVENNILSLYFRRSSFL